jgi:ABC-type cobalt transport system substrate-binding protein
VITLGSRSFAGPFMAPLWAPPKGAAVYAVMAPGWRLLTFRALEFGHAADLAEPHLLKHHPKYREWLTIVGTEWNLYVATHELPFSTEAQRAAAVRELAREYRPEFTPMTY